MSALRSMTGFAVARQETAAGELTVSLRSVNHKTLDLHFHCGQEFVPHESAMRMLLKQEIGRGHVEVRAHLTRATAAAEPNRFNVDALRDYVTAFRLACEELGLDSKPDLNTLLSLPGVLANGSGSSRQLPQDLGEDLLETLKRCLIEFNASREREGSALCEGIRNQGAEIETWTEEITRLRENVLPEFAERLRERLSNLLGETGIPESRLIEEAALLADRSDIHEETTRLLVHSKELRRILDSGGETGRRLDFLLQELNRETNTTLAKSANAGESGLRITQLGLAIRANIERIREQALNLE